jgi:hypothetical protein
VQTGYVYIFEMPPPGWKGDSGEPVMCARVAEGHPPLWQDSSPYWDRCPVRAAVPERRPVDSSGRLQRQPLAAAVQAVTGCRIMPPVAVVRSGTISRAPTVFTNALEPPSLMQSLAWCLQVNFFATTQHSLGAEVDCASLHGALALGPFPVPTNLAVASPDGRWVAGEPE